jgi:uncharacterized protein (TIGR02246 family)
MSNPTFGVTGRAAHGDVEALVALVAEIERTQRGEDVDGFLALFDPEAVWVTGGGLRLVGLEDIDSFTRQVLPGAMASRSVTSVVAHVSFLAPDVALTGVDQQYFDPSGQPTSSGCLTYIWRREEHGWKLAAAQNTAIGLDDE